MQSANGKTYSIEVNGKRIDAWVIRCVRCTAGTAVTWVDSTKPLEVHIVDAHIFEYWLERGAQCI